MKKSIIATVVAGGMILPAVAHAGHSHYRDDDPGYAYARVVSADPIVEYVNVSTPRRECREQVVRDSGYKSRSATPALLGGIIGGAVGNNIGKGKGRDVATIAGALLGASIGNDIRHKNNYYRTGQSRVETTCYTVNDTVQQREVVGYNVTYKYHGQTYRTVMDHDPGHEVKVRVDVTPLD